MVLQKGGWMSYVGPIGRHGRTMVDYVQTLPGAHPCVAFCASRGSSLLSHAPDELLPGRRAAGAPST